MTTRTILPLLIPVLMCACSSEAPQPPGPDAEYHAEAFRVEAGEDKTVCSFVRGTNEEAVDVSAFVTDQSTGGHHVVVYAVDHPINLPAQPCTQGGQPGWDTLLISQRQHEELHFPKGVGYKLAPRQQFVIETHYINASSAPIEAQSKLGVIYAPAGSVAQRAGTYYFGTTNIDLAPHAAGVSSGACAPPVPMTVHTMLGHQHRMGTKMTAQLIPGGGGAARELYESDKWEDAPLGSWSEGIAFGTTDKLAVNCEWNNTSDATLKYPKEMCFAIGYQWPAEASYSCFSAGGSDTCTCLERGNLNVGPGGSTIELDVHRAASVPAFGPEPLYCFLWRPEDLGPAGPNPGARPRYYRDAQDANLDTGTSVVTIPISDVSPGTYAATCMADLIGGGLAPGAGDVINSAPAIITVAAGTAAKADVTLDLALP